MLFKKKRGIKIYRSSYVRPYVFTIIEDGNKIHRIPTEHEKVEETEAIKLLAEDGI